MGLGLLLPLAAVGCEELGTRSMKFSSRSPLCGLRASLFPADSMRGQAPGSERFRYVYMVTWKVDVERNADTAVPAPRRSILRREKTRALLICSNRTTTISRLPPSKTANSAKIARNERRVIP